MPGLFKRHNDPVYQFLSAYVSQIALSHPARRLVVTLLIVDSERIKPILSVTQQNQQQTFDEVERVWLLPTIYQEQAIRSGDISQTPDSRSVYVPIVSADSQAENSKHRCVGLLAIESTNRIPLAQRIHFELQNVSDVEQAAFEKLRLRAVIQWQREVIETLQNICHLDHVSHQDEWAYDQVLNAALFLAPIACVGHIISVKYNPLTELPETLRLTYAVASSRNKPTEKLPVYGAYPPDDQYEYGVDDGVTGQCAKLRAVRYHADLTSVTPFKTVYDKSRSEVCYPLIVGGQVLGVLNLESEALAAFSDSDRKSLQILANEAALILFAKSGMQTRMSLLERGFHTFPTLLESLDTPSELFRALLEWSRQLGAPPFECAYFIPEDAFSDFRAQPSGIEPQIAGLKLGLPLEHEGVLLGTLVLVSANEQTVVKQQAKTLESLKPVLSAAFYGALAAWKASGRDLMARFYSNIRHTIQNYADYISSASIYSSDRAIELSTRGTIKYLSIISDIISQRDEASRQPPSNSVIHVVQRAQEVENALRWQFELADIILDCDYSLTGTAPHIRGHHTYLMWALIELLDNALKYSKDQGKKHVKLSTLWYPGSPEVVVKVEDQCKPIPQEEVEKVWQPNYRDKQAMLSSTKGRGLGLAIVVDCINELEGRRDLAQSEWGGNCFIMKFDVIGN